MPSPMVKLHLPKYYADTASCHMKIISPQHATEPFAVVVISRASGIQMDGVCKLTMKI